MQHGFDMNICKFGYPEEELSKVIESIEAEVPDIGTEDIQPSIFHKFHFQLQ